MHRYRHIQTDLRQDVAVAEGLGAHARAATGAEAEAVPWNQKFCHADI